MGMVVYIAIGIIAISIIGLGGLIFYYHNVKKKYAANSKLYQKDQIEIKNKSGYKDILDVVFQNFYLVSLKIPILSYYVRKTRLKLEMVNDYTEYQIRKETSKIMMTSVFFIFIALFVFINVIDDLYTALIAILGVFITNDMIVNSKVNKVADRITRQIPEVFTEIRHSFHEHGMVDEAFNDTIDELEDKEITPQVKRIREALLADDPESELERYYDTAPNKYLKLFAGLSYLTKELGDRKVDGVSIYLKNLNNILNDVYLDILKRDRINYRFRSLSAIAIATVLIIQPLEQWAISNFPQLINFYDSSFGFVIKVILIVSIFAAYFLLKVVKDDSNQLKFDKISSKRWQETLYNKFFLVKGLVNSLMPRQHTKKYRKKSEAIKLTNSYLTFEWLYVNKITYAVVTFIAVFILLLNMKHLDVQSVYNEISEEFLSMGKLSDEDREAANFVAESDAVVVKEVKNEKHISDEQIRRLLEKTGREKIEQEDIDRVREKIETLKDTYLRAWEVLVALVIAWIAYFIPDLTIMIKNKIRAMEKEDEVMQFQSIILMLMYIERIDVETILEWLERYAYAFKEPISTCLNNYEAGAVESLADLKDSVPNKEFQRMVDGLISSVERIPVKDAFDELETERSFYYERRKDANERLINKKSMYGRVLGFMPLVILIAGYFVGPMLVVSILQLMNYMGQMGVA